MGRWDPQAHPRGPGGRFIRKNAVGQVAKALTRDQGGSSDWAGRMSDKIGQGRGEHRRVRGKDLTGKADYAAIAAHLPERESSFDHDRPDDALGVIYEHTGYHGKPEVLGKAEMDRRVAQGWIETWRGFGDSDQADTYAEQFRSGDKHYPGLGIHGNGSYSSPSRDRVRVYAGFRADPSWGLAEKQRQFDNPDSVGWSGIARIALPPDAKIIDAWDARNMAAQAATATTPGKAEVLRDPGRWAALKGYDAMRIKRPSGDIFYVILNRSAVAVQEANRG